MRLSELKALVLKAEAQCEKHRIPDPLVCTVDFRHEGQRRAEGDDCEELRHVEEAGLIEMRSLVSACSDIEYFTREGLFANHPIFYVTADNTAGIL